MQHTLEFKKITKYFPGVKALDGVSFQARSGEVLAFLGENGAGKSTLLKTLNGDYQPDEGEYLVDGQPAHFRNPHEAIEAGISVIYQERQILMMSNLAQAQFMGDPKSILRNGKIGSIDRFTIYVSNHLPRAAAGKKWDNTTALSSGAKRHLIFAGHKSGISFASQITKMEQLRNPNDFGNLVRGLQVWGNQVTQGQALVPLVVADA